MQALVNEILDSYLSVIRKQKNLFLYDPMYINDEEIEACLDEKKKKARTDYSKEKKSGLHGWFSRAGGGGSKGWVDCNTCRKDKKTGRKKCKACGRSKGEKRSKYPACRPTPSACGTKGKGKKWGKKSKKKD